MDTSELFCGVISNREGLAKDVQKSLLPIESFWVPGVNVPSFSYLVNQAISMAYHSGRKKAVVCSDKVRPTEVSVKKILEKLNEGYGWVGLYRFALFGFSLELVQRVGPLDERFIGGGYEDCDYLFRLKEADIALYEDEDPLANYHYEPTTWRQSSKNIFRQKWNWDDATFIERLLPEQEYQYPFMKPAQQKEGQTSFLPWSKSVLLPPSQWALNAEIRQHKQPKT